MLFTHHVIKLATQIRNTDIDHFTVKSLVEEPGKSIYHFLSTEFYIVTFINSL